MTTTTPQTIILTPESREQVKGKCGTLMFPKDFYEITDYLSKSTKSNHKIQNAYVKTNPDNWELNTDFDYEYGVMTDKGTRMSPFGDVYLWLRKKDREQFNYTAEACDPNGEFSADCWIDKNA